MTAGPAPRAEGPRASTPRAARAVAVLKRAACALFVWHMMATCAQHVPRQSALHAAATPFAPYQELTGLWQAWDMFTTIPYYHSYSVDVIATEPDGKLERVGVGLPGFRRYDNVVRTETMFSRILYDPDFRPYLDAYAEKMCAELRARTGHGGHKLVVHESCERLRFVEQIRLDGVIANHEDHSSQIFGCPE